MIQTKQNTLAYMVAATVLAATEPVTRTGRAKFSDRRNGESYEQYETRLSNRRMKEAARQRTRYQNLKTAVMDKALDTLQDGEYDTHHAVRCAMLNTPGTQRRERKLTDKPLPMEYGLESDLQHETRAVKFTRNAQDILASLTTRFQRGFSSAQYGPSKYRVAWDTESGLDRLTANEAMYRNIGSKSNPFTHIRQLDRAENRHYASVRFTARAEETTITVFTAQERGEAKKTMVVKLGPSDSVVERHAPKTLAGNDGLRHSPLTLFRTVKGKRVAVVVKPISGRIDGETCALENPLREIQSGWNTAPQSGNDILMVRTPHIPADVPQHLYGMPAHADQIRPVSHAYAIPVQAELKSARVWSANQGLPAVGVTPKKRRDGCEDTYSRGVTCCNIPYVQTRARHLGQYGPFKLERFFISAL